MTSGRNLSHRVPVNLNIQVIHMENWFTNKLSLLDGILINRSPKFVWAFLDVSTSCTLSQSILRKKSTLTVQGGDNESHMFGTSLDSDLLISSFDWLYSVSIFYSKPNSFQWDL
jgi:hypothetical protein